MLTKLTTSIPATEIKKVFLNVTKENESAISKEPEFWKIISNSINSDEPSCTDEEIPTLAFKYCEKKAKNYFIQFYKKAGCNVEKGQLLLTQVNI